MQISNQNKESKERLHLCRQNYILVNVQMARNETKKESTGHVIYRADIHAVAQ